MPDLVARTPEGYRAIASDYPGVLSTQMLDDVTLDLVVGQVATDGLVIVDVQLSAPTGGFASSYVVTLSASPTGLGFDVLAVDSDSPLLTIECPTGVAVAGEIRVRLVGTGAGALVDVHYRILETLTR